MHQISLILILVAFSAGTLVNIIPDGGFETNDPLLNWAPIFACSTMAITTNPNEVHSGKQALLNSGRSGTYCDGGLELVGSLKENDDVNLTYWVKIESTLATETLKLTLQTVQATGTNYLYLPTISAPTNVWFIYNYNFTLPPTNNNTYTSLVFYFEGPSAAANIVLDDVSFIVDVTPTIVYTQGFEDPNIEASLSNIYGCSQHNITTDPTKVHSGTHALYIISRANTYCSTSLNLGTQLFSVGDVVNFSAFIKIESSNPTEKILATIVRTYQSQAIYYDNLLAINPLTNQYINYAAEWTLAGPATSGDTLVSLVIYFEGPSTIANILADDLSFTLYSRGIIIPSQSSNAGTTAIATSNAGTTNAATSNAGTTNAATSNPVTSKASTSNAGTTNAGTTKAATTNSVTFYPVTSNSASSNAATTNDGTNNVTSAGTPATTNSVIPVSNSQIVVASVVLILMLLALF